jgi:hypothetical protein
VTLHQRCQAGQFVVLSAFVNEVDAVSGLCDRQIKVIPSFPIDVLSERDVSVRGSRARHTDDYRESLKVCVRHY